MWRLKTVQHGLVFTCRRCRFNSETTDYPLHTTKEVLLRNIPTVSAFNHVKLETGSHLNAGRPLSGIWMDVELGVYVPVKSKLQHPPPGQPPGICIFCKIFVQIPPSRGRKAVQMTYHRSIPGDQMPPPPGNFSVAFIMLRKLCM